MSLWSIYGSCSSGSCFWPFLQLIWPQVYLGRDFWSSVHSQDLQKVSAASKIKSSKHSHLYILGNKGMPEAGHSRHNILGLLFLLYNSLSAQTWLIKSSAPEKTHIFTSWFLSCVQSHTFRRLSLGEWPQRESVSLLLNSKREEEKLHKTYRIKGNLHRMPLKQVKGNEILWSCSHKPTLSLKTCRYSWLPGFLSLLASFVTTAPSELL